MIVLPILGDITEKKPPNYIYYGVNGIAKYVSKVYYGVAGKAKKILEWSINKYVPRFHEEIKIPQSETNDTYGSGGRVGASFDGNAWFAGGFENSQTVSPLNTVRVFDESLVCNNVTPLSVGRYWHESAATSDYVLFAGGITGINSDNNDLYTNSVNAYDKTFTLQQPSNLSVARHYLSSAVANNSALFAGGYTYTRSNSTYTFYDRVDGYDSTLTRTTPSALSHNAYHVCGFSIGDYAVFLNGEYRYNNSWLLASIFDIYNDSFTKSVGDSTAVPSYYYVTNHARINDGELFIGGMNGNTPSGNVFFINQNFTCTLIPPYFNTGTANPNISATLFANDNTVYDIIYNTSVRKELAYKYDSTLTQSVLVPPYDVDANAGKDVARTGKYYLLGGATYVDDSFSPRKQYFKVFDTNLTKAELVLKTLP